LFSRCAQLIELAAHASVSATVSASASASASVADYWQPSGCGGC